MDSVRGIGSIHINTISTEHKSPRVETPRVDPRDLVELGKAPKGQESPPPARTVQESPKASSDAPDALPMEEPAPPPAEAQPPRALPKAAVYALCARAEELGRQLTSGKLDKKAFTAAADELVRIARSSDDPILKRTVEPWLIGAVKWPDPVSDWVNKLGPREGPSTWLRRIGNIMGAEDCRSWFEDTQTLSRFLDVLQEAGPDEAALRRVARFASVMHQRANSELDPKARAKETVEIDQSAADDCALLVQTWYMDGRVQVQHKGETIPPGRIDLTRLVKECRLSIRGTTILLGDPVRPTERGAEKAKALLDTIQPYPLKEEPDTVDLSSLTKADPAEARETVEALVAMLEPGDGRHDLLQRRISRILFQAADDPKLHALLEPQAARLRTVPSRADAAGVMTLSNLVGEAHVRLAEAFTLAFPDQVDTAWVKDELSVLLLTDEPNTSKDAFEFAERLVERRPDLLTPIIDLVTSAPDFRPRHEAFKLMRDAFDKQGWKPGQPQLEWLASFLFVPTGPGKDYTFFRGNVAYDELSWSLDLLMKIRERDAHALDGLTLPDGQGGAASLGRALFRRMATDCTEEPGRNLYTRGTSGDPWRIASRVYKLAFPDAQLTQGLFQTLEKGIEPDMNLKKLPREAEIALVVLGSLDLSPADETHFMNLLRGVEMVDHGWYWLNETVDRVRKLDTADGTGRLASGTLDPQATVDLSCNLLTMSRIGGTSFDLPRRAEPIFKSLEQGVGAQRAAVVEGLCLAGTLPASGKIDALGPNGLSALQALEFLSRTDEAVLGRLESLLQPALAVEQGYGAGVVEPLLKGMRKNRIAAALRHLGQDALTPQQRRELLDEAVAMGPLADDPEARQHALEALASGLKHTPLAEMEGVLRDPEHIRTLCERFPGATDAEQAKAWPGFREILDWVNGEPHFDDAVAIWTYVGEATAQGRARDAAIQHGLRCLALGVDPHNAEYEEDRPAAAPTTVERGERHVRIAGVDVPVRSA